MARILLSTRCRDSGVYDYFRENAPRNFRWRVGMPRHISSGLRFLRFPAFPFSNIPPAPNSPPNSAAAGTPSVSPSISRNQRHPRHGPRSPCRRHSPTLGSAQFLGSSLDEIQHPPLITEFRFPGGWPIPIGALFSSRGCSFRCTFCQTTAFAPHPKPISLDSLDRVLRFYTQHGVRFVLMLDENFGNPSSHTETVIELLARHRVRWLVQSRVDLFLRNFDRWQKCGLEGALFGIESLHHEILKQMHKNEKVQAAFELAARLNRDGLYAQGYYIIGLPSETPESTGEDLRTLASLELDFIQITIVTRHLQTEMWRDLESNYGIFEKDWSIFDTKHLAWNHPHGAPGVLESPLEQGFRNCYGGNWLPRTMKKFVANRWLDRDLAGVLSGPVGARWAAPHRLPFLPMQRCLLPLPLAATAPTPTA